MSFIVWTPQEYVNVPKIDSQHNEIVNLVNTLYTLKDNPHENKRVIKSSLKDLVTKVETHFATEERCMTVSNYEGYYSHKMEHDRFLRKLTNNTASFIDDITSMDNSFFESIKNWLFNHLQLNDRKCAAFFRSKQHEC